MIERQFGDAEGSEPVGFSHGDFCFVVQPLDYAAGELFPGAKIVEDSLLSKTAENSPFWAFILNTAPCQPRRRSPSSLRSCPKRIGSRRWAGNASKSGNSGRLRALGESLRPPEPGRRASSPVQKGGG